MKPAVVYAGRLATPCVANRICLLKGMFQGISPSQTGAWEREDITARAK